MKAVASTPGLTAEALRQWIRQSEGPSQGSAAAQEVAEQRKRELVRENRELKRANEPVGEGPPGSLRRSSTPTPRWCRSSTCTAMNEGSSRSALRFRSLRGPGRPRRRQRPFPASQGLDDAEMVRKKGPGTSVEAPELTALDGATWLIGRRWLKSPGYLSPAEFGRGDRRRQTARLPNA